MSDDELAEQLRQLRSDLDALRDRVADLERAVEGDEPQTAPTDDRAEVRSTATAPPEPAAEETEPRTTPESDWERDFGIKWLGVIGGLALVIGVFFFVQLAIEAGLLGYFGRVALGTIGGLALFAAGRFAAGRQGFVRWGRIAAGIGLAITYFSVYAAYGFDTYRTALGTPLWGVLLALTVLVAGTAALSIRDRVPIIAGEAFLLGYVTAYLGIQAEAVVVTPAYALLLVGGLVAIATVRPWGRFIAGSVLPTYGILWAWMARVDPTPSFAAAAVCLAFGAYLVGGFVLRSPTRDDRSLRSVVGVLTALNGIAASVLLELAVRAWFPTAAIDGLAIGGIGLALAVVYGATYSRPGPRDEIAGSLAVVLVGIGMVIALDTFAATLGLLALLCVAAAIAASTDARSFRAGGHLVAIGTVFKLLVIDAGGLPAFDPADPLGAATSRATAFVAGIVVFYALAWWFRRSEERLPVFEDVSAAGPYASAGTGLTVVVLALELSGVGVSVAWALLGLVLVGAGFGRDHGGLRLHGMAVLGLATVKVFVYDTRDLGPSARTLSFLVLGAILLLVSYAYARSQGTDPLQRLAER